MRIDAHQHFWNYDPYKHSWIDDSMSVLKKDFLPHRLEVALKENNFNGCVAVQADTSVDETVYLLQLADEHSFIKGVVGWVNLLSDELDDQLDQFSQNALFKGVRHVLQSEPDGYMLQKGFLNGIQHLKKYNLTYDILIFPHQLKETIQLVKKNPDQPFVLDHLAKPYIKKGEINGWKNDITELASFENVCCKVSGMVTEADWKQWKEGDFKHYLDSVFEAFGTKRLLFGSDWPVCLLASEYKEVVQIVENYIRQLSKEEQNEVMGKNAVKFYNL